MQNMIPVDSITKHRPIYLNSHIDFNLVLNLIKIIGIQKTLVSGKSLTIYPRR